jgi:hypothetical protein
LLFKGGQGSTRVLNIGERVGENAFYTTERRNSISWEVKSGKVTTTFILFQDTMKMKTVSRENISTLNPLGSRKGTEYHMCRWVTRQN